MNSTVFDSLLFRDMFGTPAMREVFGDTAHLERVVQVEVALARVQARLGLVPQDAADAIAAACDPARLDHERLRRDTDNVGYPVLPVVTQLAE
jgi:3-carboxy-cis,cis-muconate cycloisomerase